MASSGVGVLVDSKCHLVDFISITTQTTWISKKKKETPQQVLQSILLVDRQASYFMLLNELSCPSVKKITMYIYKHFNYTIVLKQAFLSKGSLILSS